MTALFSRPRIAVPLLVTTLAASASAATLTVVVEGEENAIAATLKNLPGVKSVVALGKKEEGAYAFRIQPNAGTDIRHDLFARLADNQMPLLSSRTNEPTLEELFISLTHGDNAQEKEGATV